MEGLGITYTQIFEVILGGVLAHLWWVRRNDIQERKEHREKVEQQINVAYTRLTKLEVKHDHIESRLDEMAEDTKTIKKTLSNVEIMMAKLIARGEN